MLDAKMNAVSRMAYNQIRECYRHVQLQRRRTATAACADDTGSIDHHPDDEEKPSLLMRAFPFKQGAAGVAASSPASHQPSGSEDVIVLGTARGKGQ
jgi:hypothetical protein